MPTFVPFQKSMGILPQVENMCMQVQILESSVKIFSPSNKYCNQQ
jgi:hypothetical protein